MCIFENIAGDRKISIDIIEDDLYEQTESFFIQFDPPVIDYSPFVYSYPSMMQVEIIGPNDVQSGELR